MDWKYDSTEAAHNISAYYSTNYVFTYIHMSEESCCMYIKNAELNNNRGHLFLWPFSCPFRLDHQEMDFAIRLVY